jgi:hypothetical protein
MIILTIPFYNFCCITTLPDAAVMSYDFEAAQCSHYDFDAAQCSQFNFDAAQCSQLDFDAAQCGYFDFDATQCWYFNYAAAQCGYKENNKFNYFIFLSDNMALYFIDDDLVKKILHIAFILRRGFYYHHDFVALLNKLHERLKTFNFAIILILCLHLYTNFFSKYYAHHAFVICQFLIFKNINRCYKSKIEHYSKSLIGGGAHDSNFISSELFPYNDALSNMIGIFKFHLLWHS